MAWPNPFYRRTANTRTCWGYTFELGPDHLTPEQADTLRHTYDVLGDEALLVINNLFPPEPSPPRARDGSEDSTPAEKPKPKPKRDLYVLLRDNHQKHPTLDKLWTEATTIPEWVDWDQISRGQDVFYRYGGPALAGLAYQSLLGGMGGNRVVEVLSRTGGFSVKVARRRLFETAQYVLECTRSLENIQPGGAGFASSLRVRLLHASVRQRILNLAKTRPDYYSVEKFGIPANDLDSIGTIAAFSSLPIWLSFPRQGIFLTRQETIDYVALWRLIAHYLGTPTSFFADAASAKRIMESILLLEINPSPTGQVLAKNVILALENQSPTYPTRSFLEASARWLNGHQLCDALGLGRPGLYHTCLVAGQCLAFMTLCYLHRSVAALDRRKIARLRRLFWLLIVDSNVGLAGRPTVFEFKYVPDLATTTYKAVQDEARGHKHAGADTDADADTDTDVAASTNTRVERRNLCVFLLGLAVPCALAYLCVKTSMWAARGLWSGGGVARAVHVPGLGGVF